MKLLRALSVLTVMMVGVIVLQLYGDRQDLHLPWYLLHQVILALVPMAWLLWETMPRARQAQRLAFITTSAFFISTSAIFELLAIQHRYWWFFTATDRLSGLRIGSVPLEEFIFYPLFLNLPILVFLWLGDFIADPAERADEPRARRGLYAAAAALAALAGVVLVTGLFNREPALDLSLLPAPGADGALHYSAGPKQRGWTMVQLLGLAGTAFFFARTWARVPLRRLLLTLLAYFPFAMFVELMACGRGWWVWNAQQVLGTFTWILPVESYSMYLTGALLPPLFYLWVLPWFEASELSRRGAGGARAP